MVEITAGDWVSRWSRKTEKEKQAILDKQKVKKKETSSLFTHDVVAKLIYNDGKIPIFCPSCMNWSGSNGYTVFKGKHPMVNGEVNKISGKCRKCNRPIERVFPPLLSEEAVLFGMTMTRLLREGKLVDRRKGGE